MAETDSKMLLLEQGEVGSVSLGDLAESTRSDDSMSWLCLAQLGDSAQWSGSGLVASNPIRLDLIVS